MGKPASQKNSDGHPTTNPEAKKIVETGVIECPAWPADNFHQAGQQGAQRTDIITVVQVNPKMQEPLKIASRDYQENAGEGAQAHKVQLEYLISLVDF